MISLVLTVMIGIGLLAGCGSGKPDAQGSRTITDGAGRQVEVPETVESIVCVGVGALRYTCYVGAADLVVGVEDYEGKPGMSRLYNYVNFDKFKSLPAIGTNGQPYTEEIISLAPDVIVMSAYASVEMAVLICDFQGIPQSFSFPIAKICGAWYPFGRLIFHLSACGCGDSPAGE